MNDEDQEIPPYNEIFQYLKHGEYRVDASKSEKLAGDSQESTQFRDEEGFWFLSLCNCTWKRQLQPWNSFVASWSS